MKNLLLLASVAIAMAASAQQPSVTRIASPVSAPSRAEVPEVITQQPEGRLVQMQRSSNQFAEMNGAIAVQHVNTMAEVVFADDGDVYFKNYISVLASTLEVWIRGHADGQTVTIDLPQVVYAQPEQDGQITYYQGYALDDLYNTAEPALPEVSQNQSITFNRDGDKLTQTDNRILGVCLESEGQLGFTGYGDGECVYTPFTLVPQTLPEGLETEPWTLTTDNGSWPVRVAFDGDTVYVVGAIQDIPEAAVIGTINGKKITFERNQFMGVYADTYYIYFMPIKGQSLIDKLVLNYDAEAKKMDGSRADGFAVNASTDTFFALAAYKDIHLFYQEPIVGAVMPQSPQNVTFTVLPESLWAYIGVSELRFDLSALSADGRLVDSANVYYSVYTDDDQLYTFDPDNAPKLGKEETMIPLDYNDTYTFFVDGAMHNIYFDFDTVGRIGVQSIYRADGEEMRSPIIYNDGTEKVESIVADSQAAVYYNLTGRRVEPTHGIYIRFKDGKATKIIL